MKIHENESFQKLIDELEFVASEMTDENAVILKTQQLEALADEYHDPVLKAVATFHKGDIPYKYTKFEECRKFTESALQICQEINFTYYIMRCYNTFAILDSEKADYYSSISNYLKAFGIADSHPEYQYGCVLLNNIGNLFVWLNEHEMAIDYLIQAYHKYYKEKVTSDFKLSIIVLNIIEEYSIIKDYKHAQEWSKIFIPKIPGIDETIQMINTLNQIDLLYQSKEITTVHKLVEELLNGADESDNFIYVFRSYMRLLEYSIDANDRTTASQVLEHSEAMDKASDIHTFQYDYTLLKYRYYDKFQKDEDVGDIAKQLLKEYITTSDHVVREMRNTYTRRLTIETQLIKMQQEKDRALSHTQQLQKDIELDYFTKILNKISLEKYIEKSIQSRVPNTLQSLLLIDIDHFKDVNDHYGHERGDELILSVVQMISSQCQKNMLFGRFGGDEFILFIMNVQHIQFTLEFADELLENARAIHISDTKHISFSIGIHVLDDDDDFKTSFLKADKALYKAKEKGRDRYFVYDGTTPSALINL